jgi:hypothetical protein
VRLVDGTLLGCANYAGCASRSAFAGHAAYGYCASKDQGHRGVCGLLLVTDRAGAPVGYDLKPANENEREGVFELASAHPDSVLFVDAGHRGREHHDSLALVGVDLIVPAKHKLGERPARDRVGHLDPERPDANGDPPRQDPPRSRPTRRPTTRALAAYDGR